MQVDFPAIRCPQGRFRPRDLHDLADDDAPSIHDADLVRPGFELPIDDVDTAKLVPDWDAVMAGKSGVGAPLPKPAKPGGKVSSKKLKQREQQG